MARVWSLNQGSDLGFDRLVLIGATEFRKVWHKDLRYRENSSVLEDTEGCESKKKKKGGEKWGAVKGLKTQQRWTGAQGLTGWIKEMWSENTASQISKLQMDKP